MTLILSLFYAICSLASSDAHPLLHAMHIPRDRSHLFDNRVLRLDLNDKSLTAVSIFAAVCITTISMVTFLSPRRQHAHTQLDSPASVHPVAISSAEDSNAITFCTAVCPDNILHPERRSKVEHFKPHSAVYIHDPPLPLGQSFSIVELTFGTNQNYFSDSRSTSSDVSCNENNQQAPPLDPETLYRNSSDTSDSCKSLEKHPQHDETAAEWNKKNKVQSSSSCSETDCPSPPAFRAPSEIIVDLSELSSSQECSMKDFVQSEIESETVPKLAWDTIKDLVKSPPRHDFTARTYNIDDFSDDEDHECPTCFCQFRKGSEETCLNCIKEHSTNIDINDHDGEEITIVDAVKNLNQYSAYVAPVLCRFDCREFLFEEENQPSDDPVDPSVRKNAFQGPFSTDLVVARNFRASKCINHAQWTLLGIMLSILTIIKTLIAKQQSLRLCSRAL